MNRVMKVIFRGVLPLAVAYALLFASSRQPRPYFLSITLDWIVRVGFTLYFFFVMWAIGDLLTRDRKTQFQFLENLGYPPFRLVYALLGFLAVVAMISGFSFLTYWVITAFFPQEIVWRVVIVGFVFLFSGWFMIRFYVDWIKWYRNTSK
jgi:hypothetical protein